MRIYCNHCKYYFKVEAKHIASIESKSKAVSKMEWRLIPPCPKCKTSLKIVPNGKDHYLGVPFESESKVTQNTSSKKAKMDDQLREKLQKRLETYHRYSFQGSQKSSVSKVAHRSKVAKKPSDPKLFLSIFSFLAIVSMVYIMHTVFSTNDSMMTASHSENGERLEEFEPGLNETEPVGGPTYPSESDKKLGLEDETIKKINSNLQILLLPPLKQVTSTYGVRLDPFTKKLAFHAGVDFKADMGTRIEAAMDGVVKFAGKRNMYGNAIILKHNNGYETLYGHLSRINVQKGQKVSQKDIIGLAGSSGRSTGPHLHFELIKNGKKIDPLQADLLSIKSIKKK